MIVPESDFSSSCCHCHLHKLCYSARKKYWYEISLHNWDLWLIFLSPQFNSLIIQIRKWIFFEYAHKGQIVISSFLAGTWAIIQEFKMDIPVHNTLVTTNLNTMNTKQHNRTHTFRRSSVTDDVLYIRVLSVQVTKNTGLKYMLNLFRKDMHFHLYYALTRSLQELPRIITN